MAILPWLPPTHHDLKMSPMTLIDIIGSETIIIGYLVLDVL